jgi:FtsP/CotA-like multicopper oxidase with cupredoxin domain
MRRHISLLAFAWLVACAGPVDAAESLQPTNWDAGMRLPQATDLNTDPRIVEINLEARVATVDVDGKKVEVWTYDGGLPGPLIRVRVGDRLIVHFSNKLPQPTTVHWHGLRIPVQMDGVPDISQPAVKPGEQFTYDFTVPDAGLFWYHPHVRSAAQVGYGLYGALLVEDPSDGVGVADQLVVVLSDIAIDETTGKLEDPDSGGTTGMAFGREGSQILVNGHTDATLTVRPEAPQRWRIVNAAKSRYFVLDLGGQNFTVIGVDGGLQAHPTQQNAIQMAPGERVDVVLQPKGKPGSDLLLQTFLANRGYGSIEFRPAEQELITMKFADLPAYSGPPVAKVTRDIKPLDLTGATQVELKFTIAQLGNGTFEYGINGRPFGKDKPLVAKPGETQVWTMINETAWSHPFHLHGFFFQVLDDKGAPVQPLAWKDTVDVPFKETRRLAVRFDEGHEGSWMIHCHILDHADGGLMSTVQVGTPPPGTGATHSHHGTP